jgi:hypothetical protein
MDSRPLNQLDFLLEVDDASRAGALRFQDEAGVSGGSPQPSISILSRIAYAS